MDIWQTLSAILFLGSVIVLIRDYIKTQKFIAKAASWVHTLRGFHASLEKNVDDNVAESVRKNIYATLSDMETYLREFKSYKNKEIADKKHRQFLDEA